MNGMTAEIPKGKQTILGLYGTAREAYEKWKADPEKVMILEVRRIEDKFGITGGIAKNVRVVTRIGEKVRGIKINIPAEPMIAGALGGALFAFDRAKTHASPSSRGLSIEDTGAGK
jgi:hypothetical protein